MASVGRCTAANYLSNLYIDEYNTAGPIRQGGRGKSSNEEHGIFRTEPPAVAWDPKLPSIQEECISTDANIQGRND